MANIATAWLRGEINEANPERLIAAASDVDKLASENEVLRSALQSILRGMTSPDNALWPSIKKWTKKDRDEAIVACAKKALTVRS